ncbi:MAG TPA: hypothetical protein VNW54_01150 [Granulicella sp.]|jgi:hypothetical protein|nr:hypothetical protein [Granulicella sp.]
MFMTLGGLLIIFAIHILIGAGIGSLVALIVLRKRATWRGVSLAALISIAFWLLGLHFSDLEGVSGYSHDGRWEVLPWRESTHWQNFVGDHGYFIGFSAAVLAATATALLKLRFFTKRTI